jgi:hypothetical protein
MRIRLLIGIAFLLLSSAVAFSQTAELYSRKYRYNDLSRYQKQLFDDIIADEFPKGTQIADALTDETSLRNKARLAEALLFRNQGDDKENAVAVIRWILKYQYQDESSKNYGIWRTNVVGDRFDQNWREFIGCDLIIIYQYYKNRLPRDVQEGIKTGLIHAARGALKRNVAADYTNISIMSSFLMEFVGTEFKREELKTAGLKKARDIFALYRKNKTFSEYNSPTYYGVTMIAIALWRELAFSPELKEMGRILEKEFWHEIVTFYNPTLRNMPGPYFRGYGMDMKHYYSIIGIWMAVAVDDEKLAPIPPKGGAKYGEMSNITPIFHLGLSLPKTDLAQLKIFSGPRFIQRTVPNTYTGDTLKQVTAMIYNDWMMGGLWGNRRVWGQIKTGTIHWKTADGDLGWLLVPGDGKTNVKVSKTQLEIYRADPKAGFIELYLYAKNSTTHSFTDPIWALSGMDLNVTTGLTRTRIETIDPALFQKNEAISEDYPYLIKVSYEIPASWNSDKPLLEITPTKK